MRPPLLRGEGQSGSSSSANQPTAAHLERVGLQLAADGPAVEHQEYSGMRVKPRRSPSSTAMHALGHALDAGLLAHLLHRHLGRRVADVGPARRVQPHAGVGPLHEEDLAWSSLHDRADRRLRGDVAGDALADAAIHSSTSARSRARRRPRSGRMSAATCEHLLEALPLVQALGEAEPGPGDAGERLAPPHQVLAGRRQAGSSDGRGSQPSTTASQRERVEEGPLDLDEGGGVGDLLARPCRARRRRRPPGRRASGPWPTRCRGRGRPAPG